VKKYYSISQGFLCPPIIVYLECPPPCLFCEQPVESPSTDGPLVCAWCDCGVNRDGTEWTEEQACTLWRHREAMLHMYKYMHERKS
jgi:hypothetical protein